MLSRFEALRSGATPLVGRDEELELLIRRWEQAKSGEGRVVLIYRRAGHRQIAAHGRAVRGGVGSGFGGAGDGLGFGGGDRGPTSHRSYPDVFACAVPWSR